MYEENGQQEVVVKSAFTLNVGTAPWLELDTSSGNRQINFGVAPTTADLVESVTIRNYGTNVMQVTGISTSNSDTTITTTPLPSSASPWLIPVGGSKAFNVDVATKNLSGQNISRLVTVASNARQATTDNQASIVGLVSDSWPYYQHVPQTPPNEPDIYGNILVWADDRNGNDDIFAYDLAAGKEYAICTAAGNQRVPRIGKNLIAWLDGRNSTQQDDIYGWYFPTGNIAEGHEIVISATSAQENIVER